MKSIQYQLKLVEQNDGDCICEAIKGYTVTNKVGFLAHISKTLTNVPSDTVVIFDNVLVNQGNAYDGTKGTFTAPVDGLYSFSWTILSKGGRRAFHTFLDLNGKNMGMNHSASDGDYSVPGSQSFVVQMKKGEVVRIKTFGKGNNMFSGGWSTFAGFLIA